MIYSIYSFQRKKNEYLADNMERKMFKKKIDINSYLHLVKRVDALFIQMEKNLKIKCHNKIINII